MATFDVELLNINGEVVKKLKLNDLGQSDTKIKQEVRTYLYKNWLPHIIHNFRVKNRKKEI